MIQTQVQNKTYTQAINNKMAIVTNSILEIAQQNTKVIIIFSEIYPVYQKITQHNSKKT